MPSFVRLSAVALVLSGASILSAFTSGCGDSGTATSSGGGGQGGAGSGGGTTSSTGGSGGGGPTCKAPEPSPGAKNDVTVDTVTAIARDEAGGLIKDFDFQLCGLNGCLYAKTNMLGQATFTNNLSSSTMDRPLFKPGDSLVYGKIGYHYVEGAESPFPGIFPKMTDSTQPFAAGEAVSAAGATIELDAAGVAVVDDLIYDEPAKQTFRAGAVAAADVDAATDAGGYAMVYTLGPVDTLFCPPAKLTVDNYAALPAGAAVEFWGQTLAIGEEFGGYGEWVKLSDGAVSADGSTVSTTDGQGLAVLTTVAIKAL
ncbi:MAG TPA: hypothetical protein VL400_06055 [Polyangiaceae bacterium]|jgi:hypothetical protein|nr:hypothetical protein [Polyangiaceae bacterium]